MQSPGKVVANVKLVYANGQISSNKFTFICRFDPLADKSVPAAPYITVLQQIVDEGQEKIDYLQALIDSLQGGIGATALTRNDLQNTRNPISAGAKAIDAQMAQYLLLKSDLVNNALATTAGVAPLDAAMGKTFQDQITTTNTNLNALKSKAPSDLPYISGFVVRINDQIGTGQTASLISDITFMISGKGIKSGSFGFDNMAYSDLPSGAGNWGYVEYFKHADNFVTIKLYPESITNGFYIAQFIIGQTTWTAPWKKIQYVP